MRFQQAFELLSEHPDQVLFQYQPQEGILLNVEFSYIALNRHFNTIAGQNDLLKPHQICVSFELVRVACLKFTNNRKIENW